MAKPIKTRMFDTTNALCSTENPEIFMPEGIDHVRITRQAKAVCAQCPLIETCLDFAIENKEWGVWGGTTMKERAYLKRYPQQKAGYIQSLIRTKGHKDLAKLEDENNLFLDAD